MNKFTQAPWHLLLDTLYDSNNQPIGVLAGFSSADSQLIAAAPDLMESIVHAVEQLERDYLQDPFDGHAALIKKVRSAINKAQGK